MRTVAKLPLLPAAAAIIAKVVMMPSNPPNTTDLTYYDALELWLS